MSYQIENRKKNIEMTLEMAIEKGDIDIVNHLVEDEENLEKKDKDGFTPIWLAMKYRRFDILTILAKNGANINEENDKDGCTLLTYVIKEYSGETCQLLIKLLLEYGADINKADKNGYTALAMAKDKDIVELLLNRGANIEKDQELVIKNYGINLSKYVDADGRKLVFPFDNTVKKRKVGLLKRLRKKVLILKDIGKKKVYKIIRMSKNLFAKFKKFLVKMVKNINQLFFRNSKTKDISQKGKNM